MDRGKGSNEVSQESSRSRDPVSDETTAPRPNMDAWERQQVFGEMVTLMLRNGPLSTRRRRQLVQYAAALHIKAALAGRLIEQAREDFEERFDGVYGPPKPPAPPRIETRRPLQISTWMVVSAMLLLAAILWLGVLL